MCKNLKEKYSAEKETEKWLRGDTAGKRTAGSFRLEQWENFNAFWRSRENCITESKIKTRMKEKQKYREGKKKLKSPSRIGYTHKFA